jgi:hypothetical protein
MPTNKTTITWIAPEFKHYEKNIGWYITFSSIIVLISVFFAVVENDYFATISIFLIGCLILLFTRHKPQEVEIELNHKSIKLDNLHLPYKNIKHFWIVDNHRHKTVNLVTTTMLNNIIILELKDQDPEIIREFLNQYLPEHEATEDTLAQKIMHWFKF